MDTKKITASVIDTMPFPYLNEYDLNLWVDDDNYLRVSAYQLCLSQTDELDEDGQATYQMDNRGCSDHISILCVHYDDYNEPDREAIFADLTDEWDTATGFLSDPEAWTKKYPEFFSLVQRNIYIALTDEDDNFVAYEACQHADY